MTSRSTPGYIGPNLVVHGRLSGKGELHIDGKLEGDVSIGGTLAVGAEGAVVAAVEAERVSVSGHLRGRVTAVDEVSVLAGGYLDGDVHAPRVAIDDGGVLHGGIEMDFDLPADLDALEGAEP